MTMFFGHQKFVSCCVGGQFLNLPFFCSICAVVHSSVVSRGTVVAALRAGAYETQGHVQSRLFFLSQPANDAGAREGTGVRCAAAPDWRKGRAVLCSCLPLA